MEATYRALCANGFASLTMQDIADEAEKSTSLLHYHYDTKRDLLCVPRIPRTGSSTNRGPRRRDPTRAPTFAHRVRAGQPDDGSEEFGTAILEIRAHAPYEPAIASGSRSSTITSSTNSK